jgi:pyrroloquinoline quinone (PQQ) biosynthesis protein C
VKAHEWQEELGKLVLDFVRTPGFVAYHSLKVTLPRARVSIKQSAINVRNRRDQWALLYSRCRELPVRQKIMEHEYEEMVEDEYSKYGHLHLMVRQGASIGLSADEVLNAESLPITQAVCYAYLWLIQDHTWQEGLAGLVANEMKNANTPLLKDVGGGGSGRSAKRWMEDLGLTEEQVPNSVAHSKADEKHGKMFLSVLEQHVSQGQEENVLRAAKCALDLRGVWYEGMAAILEKLE